MEPCPCGLAASYQDCCEPHIRGTRLPKTAEALMRSRYSAFAKKEIDYILQTTLPSQRKKVQAQEVEAWSTQSTWKGFEIKKVEGGGENDDEGTLEFVARYAIQDQDQEHRERSRFVREGGRWYFDPGHSGAPPLERAHAGVGRNDPCPCGSGKKFKKCCGAAT